MKKFLIVLLLLIVIAAAVFFAGWAHLTVPPGSYGVMRSKTHGLDPNVIRDGEFLWLWYKLIPTNMRIVVFKPGIVRRPIRTSGRLGSGEIYADLAGIDADFSWEISGEISFSLRPEALPDLCARESIENEQDLRRVEERLAERIENLVLQRLRQYAEEDERKMETLIFTGSLPELDSEITRTFREIENLTCTIKVARYPDYELYQSLRILYRRYLDMLNVLLSPEIAREAEKRIEVRVRLDELTRYGELLTRYPILLEYLALEKELPPFEWP